MSERPYRPLHPYFSLCWMTENWKKTVEQLIQTGQFHDVVRYCDCCHTSDILKKYTLSLSDPFVSNLHILAYHEQTQYAVLWISLKISRKTVKCDPYCIELIHEQNDKLMYFLTR